MGVTPFPYSGSRAVTYPLPYAMVTPGVVPSPSAAPAAPAPASALPRRRNGKPQSCEPCRLAKTACDHTFPKCNRCVRRGIDARCTYHPSPMTKAQGSPKVIQHTEPWKKHCQLARTATPNILSLLAQQRSPVATPQGISNARGERDTEAQYLGSTSYSAVFQENKESIGSEVWNGPSSIDLSCVKGQDSDSHRLRLALSALRAIPDQDVCELLLDSDFEVHASPLHEPATRYCLQSLWDTYGDALRDRDDDGRIRQMAQEILRNTDTPVSPQPTSAEWLESHTGKNLRFEMVGTLLALFALALPVLPDQHPVYRAQDLSPFEYTYKLGKAAENCQMVCFDMSIVNEFSLYLNYHLQVTQGIVRGEDSECWPQFLMLNTKLSQRRWILLAKVRPYRNYNHCTWTPPREYNYQVCSIHGRGDKKTDVHGVFHRRQATRNPFWPTSKIESKILELLACIGLGRPGNHAPRR